MLSVLVFDKSKYYYKKDLPIAPALVVKLQNMLSSFYDAVIEI